MVKPELIDRIRKVAKATRIPMHSEQDLRMVEIIILKFKEEPEVINECVNRIVNQTMWPFKLNIYDNRWNTANTAKIWNKLIRDSNCDYVLMIDSDAFVPCDIKPCWLTRLMESIDDCDIVYPVGDNVGGVNGGVTQAEEYGRKLKMPDEVDAKVVKPADLVASGFCYLVKKSHFDTVGWFDEDFNLYGQDSEWSHRCNRKGGAIIRKDVFVRHIGNYSSTKHNGTGYIDQEADKQYARELFLYKTGMKKRI
jgi:GT2 family glycosyltransferase